MTKIRIAATLLLASALGSSEKRSARATDHDAGPPVSCRCVAPDGNALPTFRWRSRPALPPRARVRIPSKRRHVHLAARTRSCRHVPQQRPRFAARESLLGQGVSAPRNFLAAEFVQRAQRSFGRRAFGCGKRDYPSVARLPARMAAPIPNRTPAEPASQSSAAGWRPGEKVCSTSRTAA